MMAPRICNIEMLSPKIKLPARIETTVEIPTKDEVRLTPILEIA